MFRAKLIFCIASTLIVFFYLVPIGFAATVDDFFLSALRHAERVANAEQTRLQVEERRNQAIAGIAPSLQILGSYTVQDRSGLTGVRADFAPAINPNVRINAVQPLFRGFAEYARLSQTKVDSQAEKFNLLHAARVLYLDVAQAFLSWSSFYSDRSHAKQEIELIEKRLVELRERARVGRSRLSEVLNLEVALANKKSELQQIEQDLALAKQNLDTLTDLSQEPSLVANDVKIHLARELSAKPLSSDDLENRFDVQAAKLRVSSANEGVRIARSGHWPSLDLAGNYYLDRAGFLETVKWDVSLIFSVPLFNGGLVQSQVRVASSLLMQAELSLALIRRQAQAEASASIKRLQKVIDQAFALENSKKLAEKNFKEQTREYRLGLVNNGEVLLALTGYQGAERAWERTMYSVQLAQYQLQMSRGELLSDWDYERLMKAMGR